MTAMAYSQPHVAPLQHPIPSGAQTLAGVVLVVVIASLVGLVDSGSCARRIESTVPFDTIPRRNAAIGKFTLSLGGLVSGGALILNLIDHLNQPNVSLTSSIRVDTLRVPVTSAQRRLVPSFSEPWVRASISIRNTGTAPATGVTINSPIGIGRRWPHTFQKVGAREPNGFKDKQLAIGALPPDAWAEVSLWWRLGETAPPLAAFVVLHDVGTVKPTLAGTEALSPTKVAILIGLGLLALGGLVLGISLVWTRRRTRRT
jgi:hypothetical protein